MKPDVQKTPQDHNIRHTPKNGNQQISPSRLNDAQSAKRNTEEHDLTILRTRSGRISKKPDRLIYKWEKKTAQI